MFELKLVKGDVVHSNGKLARRVLLEIDGVQKDVSKITLDSDLSVRRIANGWSKSFGLDADTACTQLRELAVAAAADAQAAQERREQAQKGARRIVDLAAEFLRGLRPRWHRNRKTI